MAKDSCCTPRAGTIIFTVLITIFSITMCGVLADRIVLNFHCGEREKDTAVIWMKLGPLLIFPFGIIPGMILFLGALKHEIEILKFWTRIHGYMTLMTGVIIVLQLLHLLMHNQYDLMNHLIIYSYFPLQLCLLMNAKSFIGELHAEEQEFKVHLIAARLMEYSKEHFGYQLLKRCSA